MPSIRLGCRSPRPRRSGRSATSPASRSKMLAASERHRDRAMAGWQGVKALEELFGYEPGGSDSAVPARRDGGRRRRDAHRDGIDTQGHTARSGRRLQTSRATSCATDPASTGGRLRTPAARDLPRRSRREPDVHGALGGGDPTKILHTFGVEQPESPGLWGLPVDNEPVRDRPGLRRSRRAGRRGGTPGPGGALGRVRGLWRLRGHLHAPGDVYRAVSMGGGGYGDPLDRDPLLVARDVERSASSRVNGPSGSGALC